MTGLRVPIVADDEQFQRKLRDSAGAARLFSREWSDAQIKVALAKDKLAASEKRYGAESAQAARATLQLRSAQRELITESRVVDSRLAGTESRLRGLRRELGSTERGLLAGSGAFRHMGRSIAFASASFIGAAGFIDVVKTSINQADSLDHAIERTSTVFGSNAAQVKRWSKDSADSMGLSRAAALSNASAIGQLLKNMDFVPAKAAAMSQALVQRASDVGAAQRAKPGDVLNAFEAGLAGRTRGLKQYGIVIDAAALKDEAYRLGIAKVGVDEQKVADARARVAIATARAQAELAKYGPGTTQAASAALTQRKAEEELTKQINGKAGALTAAQKAEATYALILDQTSDAQGKFKHSSHDLDVQQLKLRAEISNLEADIGNQLRPEILAVVADLDHWIKHLNETGEAQRLVKEAIRDFTIVAHAGVDVIHTAETAFEALAKIVGGNEQAVKALVAAFGVFKTAQFLASLKTVATTLGLIGGAAETSAAKVTASAATIEGDNAAIAASAETAAAAEAGIGAGLLTGLGVVAAGEAYGIYRGVTAPASDSYGTPQDYRQHNGHYQRLVPGGRAGGKAQWVDVSAGEYFGATGGRAGGGQMTPQQEQAQRARHGAHQTLRGYQGMAAQAADAYGIPTALFLAQIKQESGFDPNARSKAGAKGIAQFMDGTMGSGRAFNPWDPSQALPKAAELMARLYAKYHDYGLALAAYNAGEGTVDNYLAGKQSLPGETINYVKSITGMAVSGYGSLAGSGSGAGSGLGGSGLGSLHVGTAPKKPPKPKILTGAALLPISLRTELAHASSLASTDSGSAALTWLKREKADLEQARKLLEAKLKTATGKQHDAVKLEISNIDKQLNEVARKTKENLKQQAAAVKASFAPRVDAAKSTYTEAFNQIQSDLISQLQQNTQTYIDNVLGPKYFQGVDAHGMQLQTPLEAKLAAMQSADTSKSLQDALDQAKKQLGLDQNGSPLETILDVATGKQSQIFSGAGPADQIQADNDAITAAQRAIDENKLATDAVAERAQADADYAASVKQAQADETVQERNLNAALVDLQNGVLNGTRKLSDLSGIAEDFGLKMVPGGVLDTDFTNLGSAAKELAIVLLDEAARLAALGDAVDAARLRQEAADLGGRIGPGGPSVAQQQLIDRGFTPDQVAGLDPGIMAALLGAPHLAKGGIVSRPTLALVGEAGREAIVPLDSGGIASGQAIENHITVTLDGKVIWQGVKPHAYRNGRLNVTTGVK